MPTNWWIFDSTSISYLYRNVILHVVTSWPKAWAMLCIGRNILPISLQLLLIILKCLLCIAQEPPMGVSATVVNVISLGFKSSITKITAFTSPTQDPQRFYLSFILSFEKFSFWMPPGWIWIYIPNTKVNFSLSHPYTLVNLSGS